MKNHNETLLDKALQNLNCAKVIYNSDLTSGSEYLNHVAFHLQQAVIRAFEYVFEKSGKECIRTNDLEQMIIHAGKTGTDLKLTPYIYSKAEMLSAWGPDSREKRDYIIEKKKISEAVYEVGKYISAML